ncbi:MAG: TIGR04211 family SH3 domain-containing protein [Desulfobacteraceae bacterium]|nr:TIGR04211 family SH3 domain-containing protein [Desulfobacteraceae bacterium]
MKKTAILSALSIVLCLLTAAFAAAETNYVTDLNEITLRAGPGLDYRVNRMLKSGQQLEVLDTEERWTQVRLPDGTIGWVFSKFISDQKPDSLAVKDLREEITPLRKKVKALEEENQRLIRRTQELGQNLEETKNKLENARKEYNELKQDSKNFLELKEKHEELTKNLEGKEQRVKTLEQQLNDAFLTSGLKWFLAGAGVLLLGIILGRTSGSRKKRSSLL